MTGSTLTNPIDRKVLEVWALYRDDIADPGQFAALCGLPLIQTTAILDDPGQFAELEAYAQAQQVRGKLQPVRVRKLLELALGVIEKQLKSDCDIDAALEIIKPLIRLTEVIERTRLAERDIDAGSKRAIVHINFGGVPVVIAPILADVSGVIDVQAVQIPTSAGGTL